MPSRWCARASAKKVAQGAGQVTVEVRGTVRPTVDADLQLAATLSSGEHVVGQHRLTGKECPPIDAPIVLYRASTTNPARTIAHWSQLLPNLSDVVVAGRHRGFDSIMATGRVEAIANDLAARW